VELLAEQDRRRALAAEGLLGFVPRVSPHLIRPDHLAPLARVFERIAAGERVRACVSVPPQHGKTLLVLHAVVWLLGRPAAPRLAYITYNQDQADAKSFDAGLVADAAGLARGRDTLGHWVTLTGGAAVWAGVGGKLTGQPADLVLVDDPYKNRVEAESPAVRARVQSWLTSAALTRLPEAGSCVLVHTRWHQADVIGRAQAGDFGPGWERLNLPFLANAAGEPDDAGDVVLLPPHRLPTGQTFGWTVDGARARLREVGPYDAASLYQGRPRARGGLVFHEPTRYDGPPDLTGARLVLADDPAGSDAPDANRTVVVALAVRGTGDAMTADLVGLLRLQARPEAVAPRLLRFQRRFSACLRIEASRDGKEQARCLGLLAGDLALDLVPPQGDKFLRAQPVAAAWNAAPARVRVPARAAAIDATEADLSEFCRVVTGFTGLGDAEDDDVDALSLAWNAAAAAPAPYAGPPARPQRPRPRWEIG
jgi:hypothetical protein